MVILDEISNKLLSRYKLKDLILSFFLILAHSDQRIARLEQQLKDLRSAAVGATPEGLLQVNNSTIRMN